MNIMSAAERVSSSAVARLRSGSADERGALRGSSRAISVALTTAAAVALIAILTVVAKPRVEPRVIELTVRDMAFYLSGRSEPNPEIRVQAGEDVRIVLRNLEAGVTHDFVVGSLGVAIDAIRGRGEGSIVLRAPEQTGTHQYVCTPHSRMMRGSFVVE